MLISYVQAMHIYKEYSGTRTIMKQIRCIPFCTCALKEEFKHIQTYLQHMQHSNIYMKTIEDFNTTYIDM